MMQPARGDAGPRFSWVPIVGYESTYGLFLGGGYFYESESSEKNPQKWSMAAIVAQKRNVAKLLSELALPLDSRWQIHARNQLMSGFEPNYGLGSETVIADRVDVPFWKDEIELAFPYFLTEHFSLGPALEGRFRHNRHMLASDRAREKDPVEDREATLGLSIIEEIDFRDNPRNPSNGWSQKLVVSLMKPNAAPFLSPFAIIDAEMVTYTNLERPALLIATSLSAGAIFGSPTYLGEFQIGGSRRLRGFYYNRFRGSRYYVQQNELRFPVFRAVSGAAFLEFGEATMRAFTRAHGCVGGGLRIGLPPDQISRLRIDYAISVDQKALIVDFGQAF